MFAYCRHCQAFYSKYNYDAPSVTREVVTLLNIESNFIEREHETGDVGESRTYCINNPMHDDLDMFGPYDLSKEEKIELMDMFKENGTIKLKDSTSSQIARLRYLLKIEGNLR